ncbi:MAG: sodium:proton antiporter [bacterium]
MMIWATVLFILIYAVIVSEKIHRTVITLAGVTVFIAAGFISQEQALEAVDFNTIGLLVGMMIIVGVLQHTGLFEYVAIKQAKAVGGEPWKLLVVFSVITAFGSAFLDNVTTVLLMIPVTLAITDLLELDATPFVIAEILMSNIGGTATLIGDPPNIMIGSALGLGFMDFIIHLTPIVLIVFFFTLLYVRFVFQKRMYIKPEMRVKLKDMDENEVLKDLPLAKKCLCALGVTILGFVLHQIVHIELATVALGGAAFLLLIAKVKIDEAFNAVEWPVIFFFISLFILVSVLKHVGLVDLLAKEAIALTHGNVFILFLVVMWGAGIGSAFLGNVPFVATAIPLFQTIQTEMGDVNFMPVWWALALGACFGGNGTILGANANVPAIGIAEDRGVKITYLDYFKVAFPFTIMTLGIATAYIILRYFLLQ